MKRFTAFVACLAASTVLSTAGRAWGIELSGMGGYQFGGKLETSSGDIKLKDAAAFSAALEFPLKFKKGTSLIALWSVQPTDLVWETSGGDLALGDVSVHYIHGGLLYNLRTDNPDLVPFTMVTLGATLFYPDTVESTSKFSFNMGAGLKYSVSPKVAIRLQGDLYATMFSSEAWAGVGTGGVSIGVGGNAMLQGAVMAGVTISLGGEGKESEPAVQPPPAQQPPAQQPPPQQPPAQQPPAQQPPATEPPATQTPATQPPATEPPATQPPASQPPATEPPATTTGTTPPSR
jgi:hypothetical protein